MRTALIFILASCFAFTSYSQNKVKPKPAKDSIQQILKPIITRLGELERNDSIRTAKASPEKSLWDYVQDLRNDTHQHQEFIQNYYDKMYLTFTIVIGLFGAILTFLGFQSFKQIEKHLAGMFETQFNERFHSLWTAKNEEIENMIKGLRDEIAKHQQINNEQTSQINFLDQLVSEIKKNIHVKRSAVILEYIKADGSELIFYREQEIICSSKDYPIHETTEAIEIEAPGTVQFIEGTKNELASAVATDAPNGCSITMSLKKPLVMGAEPFLKFVKCRLFNGFVKQHEQFLIIQPYPCDEEIFEIKLRKERNASRIWVERLEQHSNKTNAEKSKFVTFDCPVQKSEGETYYSHKLELPRSQGPIGSPPSYRIHWEF